MVLQDEASQKLVYITLPPPAYSFPYEESDEEDEEYDSDAHKARRTKRMADAKKYMNKLASNFPSHPFIISRAAERLANNSIDEAAKRDPSGLDMYVYNDYTGYGLQEIMENHLSAMNSLMRKKPEPNAVDLWIQLSAFAH